MLDAETDTVLTLVCLAATVGDALDTVFPGAPEQVLPLCADWDRSLSARPDTAGLADHIADELRCCLDGECGLLSSGRQGWVRRGVRQALGLNRPAHQYGHDCPDHRDSAPTPLSQAGDRATLAPSLLAGPPRLAQLDTGGRLHTPAGPTDWVVTRAGAVAFAALDGSEPWSWSGRAASISCPHCHREWSGPSAVRLLLRELRAAGDAIGSDAVAAAT